MKEIIDLLKKGKTIIYPTDTAYALGGDLLNSKTRAKIYKIKQRNKNKNLTAIANSFSMVKKYCYINKKEEKLVKQFWPGPLTIVLKTKQKYKKILGDSLAIRVPNNKIARNLSKKLNKPIISTSANLTNKKTCYDIKSVLKQLGQNNFKPDMIIDDGKLENINVSTIIQLQDGKIKILRKGVISL